MSLCTIGTRSVATTSPDTPVEAVACLMNQRSVGSVVIVEDDIPLGILTDRDLVMRVICKGLDPKTTSARDVMSTPLKTVEKDHETLKAATLMREAQVRRLPVIAEDGKLVGIISLDDLTFHLSRCYSEMAEAISAFPVPHEGG